MPLLLYIGDATVSLIHIIFSEKYFKLTITASNKDKQLTYGDYRTVAPLFVSVVVCRCAAPPVVACMI